MVKGLNVIPSIHEKNLVWWHTTIIPAVRRQNGKILRASRPLDLAESQDQGSAKDPTSKY